MSNAIASLVQTNTDIASKIAQAQQLQEQANALLAESQAEKTALLNSIPTALGYTDNKVFVNELMIALGMVAAPTEKPEGVAKKRATITVELRKAIIDDLKLNTFTSAQIAEKHGVSVPSVNLIKSDAGLTNRNAAPATAPAASDANA